MKPPIDEQITLLLAEMRKSPEVADEVVPLVYSHLRAIARRMMLRERAGHSLQPTALVHEAWLKLSAGREQHFQDRKHFFAIAASAMRQILIDYARSRSTQRRKAEMETDTETLEQIPNPADARLGREEIIALDEALARLDQRNPTLARIVELRCFCDFSVEETATALGLSSATIKRQWQIAKAWLLHELDQGH